MNRKQINGRGAESRGGGIDWKGQERGSLDRNELDSGGYIASHFCQKPTELNGTFDCM